MMKNASGTSSSRYSVPYRFKYVPHRMVERPVKSRRTIALVDCKRIPSFPFELRNDEHRSSGYIIA